MQCRGSTRSWSTWASARPCDSKKIDAAVDDLTAIAGQKPVVTRAQEVDRDLQAARGHADRLQGDAAPRPHVRIPRPAGEHRAAARARLPRPVAARASTGRGNYAMGLKEQIVFPEIDYDQVDAIRGMDIIICTTAQDRRRSAGAAQGLRHAVPELTADGRSIRHGQEKRHREEQEARAAGAASSPPSARALKAIANDRDAAAGGTLRGAAEAGRTAAQRRRAACATAAS